MSQTPSLSARGPTRVVGLVGPTAAGKTSIAVDLAEPLGAEIVCCDSMTIYRGMDIGTAKPTADDRARAPHHLLDVADLSEVFTVARFQRLAHEALEAIAARGRTAMLVGGSGLYLRAVVDDLQFPPTDRTVRAVLAAQPAHVLARRLAERDPEALGFVDLKNHRRVVRALEVIELTGRAFSSFRAAWGTHRPLPIAGLRLSAPEQRRRIEDRLRAMLDAGFLEEVRALLARGYRSALTASQAVAYREAIELLEGRLDREGFIERAASSTRRLARRQMAWFRRDPRVRWFDADEVADARARIQAYLAG